MKLAHGFATRPVFARFVLASTLLVMLGACSHGPEQQASVAPEADIAHIGPRPHVFGRHAWDVKQARAAAAQANASAPVAVVAPPAPVAVARTAPPLPSPKPVTPAPAPPSPPPPPVEAVVASVATAAPVVAEPVRPAPVKPQVVQKAKPAKPAAKPGSLFFWNRPSEAPAAPVVGGYQAATDKKAVAAAAAFAVHQSPRYLLKGIYSAKVQVVAGTNYSLCLWVRTPGHEANPFHRRMVAATVFQGLDQHFELTSWQEVNTCRPGS